MTIAISCSANVDFLTTDIHHTSRNSWMIYLYIYYKLVKIRNRLPNR